MSDLNAGRRLAEVIKYLELGNQSQIAEFFKKGQATVSRWLGKSKFSDVIIRDLEVLTQRGINIAYFEKEGEPMLLKDVVSKEVSYREFLELKTHIEEMRTERDRRDAALIDALEKLNLKIDKLLNQ